MAAERDRQIDDIRDLWAEDGPSTRSADPGAGSDLEALVIETIEALAAKGIGADDIEPLSRLRTAVRSFAAGDVNAEPAERRSGGVPASDMVLARVCVVIDLLIQAGYSHDKAVQMMARQLMLSNVVLPNSGGDARGWKRLSDWHSHLVYGQQSADASQAQAAFRDELAAIPATERLTRVLEQRLWDERGAR